jgi:hypothetical protein
VALFENHPEVREKWQNRLRYLLIDEYQDTNASQYQLLKLLAGPRAAFTAVGDDDQAIYGWRGADIENLRGLPRDYPNLKLIKLEQNYRSTVRILKAANALIAHNEKLFDKKLWSDLGHGDPITVSVCQDKEKEAEAVVMKLQAHRFEHRARSRITRSSTAATSRRGRVEQFLRNQRIPYLLSGGQSFFDKSEIKDITAYLRLLANMTTTRPSSARSARPAWRRHQHPAGARQLRRRTPDFHCSPPLSNKASRSACRHASWRRCSSSANSSIACRRAPARSGGAGADRPAQRDRLRGLAVRARREARGADQSGATCRSSATGWARRARRSRRP